MSDKRDDKKDDTDALPKVIVDPLDVDPLELEGDLASDLLRLKTQVDQRPLDEILGLSQPHPDSRWQQESALMEDEDGEKKTTRMPCVVVDEFQMLDTIPDVDAETTEQVRHALRTVELKTAEMDIVEERFVGETAEDDDTAPTEAVPVARAGLASETNVLLDAIEQGAARSVIVVCEGSASDRPRVPPAELAMALAEAHVAVAQQLLDGVVDDGGGEAGARIARLRQMLDHDSE